MKKMLLLLNVLCLSLFSLITTAYADEEHPYYHSVLFNSFNALPTSQANDIIQTKDGQIWIASYSSLIRYDGRTFNSYAGQGFASIMCLYEDTKGRLWIGTNNDGLVLLEDNKFIYTAKDIEVPSYSTRAITENADGSIIVGTARGLYQVLPDYSILVIDEPRLQDILITDLISYGDNFTIGLTKSGDIFILQGSKLVKYITLDEFGYDSALSIYYNEDENSFLLGTIDEYIVEMKQDNSELGYSFKKIPTKGLYHINTIMKDSRDRIWIGSDTAVGYFDYKFNLFVLDYITVGSFENIYEDIEGNFWLASGKEGVLKLSVSQFRNLTSNLPHLTQVNAVEIVDDLIYTVTPNGIYIQDKKTNRFIENALTRRYRDSYFRCVEKDAEGNLWFSTYTDDQLVKYTPKTGAIKSIGEAQGLTSKRIRNTLVASDGRVWVGTGNGAYVVENDVVVRHYHTEDGLKNLEVLSITEDKKGRIFVSTDGAGVYIIENNEVSYEISRKDGLTTDIVLRTETDPRNGGTWILTGNSIAFFDTDNAKLTTIKNFPYSNNFDLFFYKDEIIVLSSNGLYFTTPEELLKGKDQQFFYLYKNHLDGLHSNPVANAFSKIDDGILYICGYQNLSAYALDSTTSTAIPPTIDLPSIIVNNKNILPNSSNNFILPETANFFELNILIPTYSLQDYYVSYWIENYDENPHSSSYKNFTNPTYTNLPGGKYTLFIEVTDARSNEVIALGNFSIIKEYSLFENPTIRLVIAYGFILLLVSCFYVFYKRRMDKINQQKQIFTEIFREMVEMLSKIIDSKDNYTKGHSSRVGHYSKVIAKSMGLDEDEQFFIYGAGLLHDIGKISIPDEVLNKSGKLTDEEFALIKTHPAHGADILETIQSWPELHLAAGYHHERFDGRGYPQNLNSETIPLIARIICVADAFDAMYSSRVYRKKMEFETVILELEENAGTQFDPEIVKVFLELLRSGELDELLAELNPE